MWRKSSPKPRIFNLLHPRRQILGKKVKMCLLVPVLVTRQRTLWGAEITTSFLVPFMLSHIWKECFYPTECLSTWASELLWDRGLFQQLWNCAWLIIIRLWLTVLIALSVDCTRNRSLIRYTRPRTYYLYDANNRRWAKYGIVLTVAVEKIVCTTLLRTQILEKKKPRACEWKYLEVYYRNLPATWKGRGKRGTFRWLWSAEAYITEL